MGANARTVKDRMQLMSSYCKPFRQFAVVLTSSWRALSGGNTGSNPVGDAREIKELRRLREGSCIALVKKLSKSEALRFRHGARANSRTKG